MKRWLLHFLFFSLCFFSSLRIAICIGTADVSNRCETTRCTSGNSGSQVEEKTILTKSHFLKCFHIHKMQLLQVPFYIKSLPLSLSLPFSIGGVYLSARGEGMGDSRSTFGGPSHHRAITRRWWRIRLISINHHDRSPSKPFKTALGPDTKILKRAFKETKKFYYNISIRV
jgi:hypothetical protein